MYKFPSNPPFLRILLFLATFSRIPPPPPPMAEQNLLNLFDSYWFEHGLFEENPSLPPPPPPASQPTPTIPNSQEDPTFEETPKFSRMPTIHNRSLSDQPMIFDGDFSSDLPSPSSVLHAPKLETILSGKDIGEFPDQFAGAEGIGKLAAGKNLNKRGRRRKDENNSKSLSQLEFEELKGFMDLGFVFSAEDRDSSLVSILPGLQRLGRDCAEDDDERKKEEKEREKIGGEDEEEDVCRPIVSRPYLSEAWGVLNWREERKPLMNWEIPSLGDEIVMKDHLRFWAHKVASAVK